MTDRPPGARPGAAPVPQTADAVPVLTQKDQENVHRQRQEPATEQEWLGNQVVRDDAALRLLRIERTTTRALSALQDGELDAAISRLQAALTLALAEQALSTTCEGQS